ncbi:MULTISPECIES: hypothetical protein [Streptomyces]|uniref:Uncharacterized protein n=2 Tax=Streptomyces TaxID=1883 RepID=A0A646KTE2_STRJU|nr:MULTISPECIES: hypothetical protein [Streptomyces]MQS39711.1 hypothetical protein [Streptomyces katsurahamanus]MQT05505.1 hypothetical protein [Streptomyces jumonjinensis]
MDDMVNSAGKNDVEGSRRKLRLAVAAGVGAGLSVALVATGLAFAFLSDDDSDDKRATVSSSSSASPASEKYTKNLAFAQCLRDKGVSKFPDPDPSGAIRVEPDSGIDIKTKEYKSAENACKEIAPPMGERLKRPSGLPSLDTSKYVGCMRENGMPDFPDPDGGGMFTGIDLDAPDYKAAQAKCGKFMPVLGVPTPAGS